MNAVRDAALEIFKRQAALRTELVDLLRSQPQVIPADMYTFTENGRVVGLNELFGERRDLVVIHNMGASCRYCTLWADGFNGLLPHIESRTAIVLMNRDAPDDARRFAEGRGWGFRMVRDDAGAFTRDMGFAEEANGGLSLWPGYSTFHRADDGTITRIGFDGFGPGDVYMPVFPLFELLKDGDAGWQPQYRYDPPLSISLPSTE
jgi:predicted dithiol-disulfide oxidoreductase (DUF899 family)